MKIHVRWKYVLWYLNTENCCLSYVTKQNQSLLKQLFLQRGNYLLIFHANPSRESRWRGIYIKVKTESISCTRVVTSSSKSYFSSRSNVQYPTFKAFFFFLFFFLNIQTKCLGNLWAIWNNCKCTNFSNQPITKCSTFKAFL